MMSRRPGSIEMRCTASFSINSEVRLSSSPRASARRAASLAMPRAMSMAFERRRMQPMVSAVTASNAA